MNLKSLSLGLCLLAATAGLAACQTVSSLLSPSPSSLATPAGQIFCAIQTKGGGQLVVGLADATATATAGAAAPLIAIGLAAEQANLNAQCAAAALLVPNATGSTGAVPAPAMPVQTVAVKPITPVASPAPVPTTELAPTQ